MNGIMGATATGIMEWATGLMGDLRTLLRQEVQLLRDELHQEVGKVRRAVVSLGIGIAVTVVGGLFALVMIVQLLAHFTALPLWACYGIIAGLLLIVGVVMLVKGAQSLQSFDIVPRRTIQSVKENTQWIKDQMPSNEI